MGDEGARIARGEALHLPASHTKTVLGLLTLVLGYVAVVVVLAVGDLELLDGDVILALVVGPGLLLLIYVYLRAIRLGKPMGVTLTRDRLEIASASQVHSVPWSAVHDVYLAEVTAAWVGGSGKVPAVELVPGISTDETRSGADHRIALMTRLTRPMIRYARPDGTSPTGDIIDLPVIKGVRRGELVEILASARRAYGSGPSSFDRAPGVQLKASLVRMVAAGWEYLLFPAASLLAIVLVPSHLPGRWLLALFLSLAGVPVFWLHDWRHQPKWLRADHQGLHIEGWPNIDWENLQHLLDAQGGNSGVLVVPAGGWWERNEIGRRRRRRSRELAEELAGRSRSRSDRHEGIIHIDPRAFGLRPSELHRRLTAVRTAYAGPSTS